MSDINTNEVFSVERKRRVLEKLVRYAKQLTVLLSSLDASRELLKPSQQPRRGQLKYLAALLEKLECHGVDTLMPTLKKLDAEVQREMRRILRITQMTEAEFFARFEGKHAGEIYCAYQALENEIKAFKKHSQTNLAIRICLHEQGVSLNAIELPVSQEQLITELSSLKNKETACRKRILNELSAMVKDLKKVIDRPELPQDYRNHLLQLHGQLGEDLRHLQVGGSLEDFSNYIELIDLGYDDLDVRGQSDAALVPVKDEENSDLSPSGSLVDPDSTDGLAEISMPYVKRQAQSTSARGFWSIFRRWINSPWSVTWSMVKSKKRR